MMLIFGLLRSWVLSALGMHAYSFQTFSVLEVLGAAKMNQIEVNIRDHIHGVSSGVAGGAFARVVRTAGNVTTTSTSLVDLTGATATITTSGRPVAVSFLAAAGNSAGSINYFNVLVDGSAELGAKGLAYNHAPASNGYANVSFSHTLAALSAAAHTIKMQWFVDAGTGIVYADTDVVCSFSVNEVSG